MKRRLLVGLILLLAPIVRAQNPTIQGWCETGAQPVVTSGLTSSTLVQQSFPACTVTAFVHGGGLATIFADSSNTPLSNPFTAQSNGRWLFYAASGRYDVQLSGAGFPSLVTYSDIVTTSGSVTLSAAGETLYVSGNGNDANSGLSWAVPKLTLCAAVRTLYDTGFAAGQILLSIGTAGSVQASSVVNNGQAWGCYMVQGQDPNFLTVVSITRSSNVVTLTANKTIPVNTWWVAGRKLSLMGGCPDKSFNGDFTIVSVAGSTITWNQTGANDTSTCGTILPFGFVPAPPNSSKFFGFGAGNPVRVNGGQIGNTPITISSISESGNTVTVNTATNHGMSVGQFVRITDVPEQAPPLTPAWVVAGTNVYNGMFLIQTVPDATHFTYILPAVTAAATQTSGFATLETPTVWFAGGQHAQFNNIEFGPSSLPFIAGWGTDWQNQAGTGAPPLSDFYFEHCYFTVDQGTTVEGPAEWIGPNVLWYRHKHIIHNANTTASVTSDQRAAMMEDTGPGGSSTGIITYDGEQQNGGGFRIRGSGSTTSVLINDIIQEGASQSPPVVDLLPQAVPSSPGAVGSSSTFVKVSFPGASDSGDNPPVIRVSPIYATANMEVTCFPGSGTMFLQGPGRTFGCENNANFGFNSGGEPTNPTSRRQRGDYLEHAGFQVDDLRRSLLPTIARFTNSAAQSPASWTNAFGTGIAVGSGAGPGDAPGTSNTNVGYLTCTANASDPVSGTSYCAVRAFSSSRTFNFGDYVYGGVWAKPTDASTAFTFGLGGGANWPALSVFGPNFLGTYTFDGGNDASSPGGASTRFNAGGYTRNDGNWQWLWFWWKCTNTSGCGTATFNMQLNFSVTNPWAFAYPMLVFVPGSQIVPPVAPTVSQVAGGSLAQRTYLVFATYVNARGETTLSAKNTITVSASNLLQVTSPGASGGATGWNVYVYNQAGLSVSASQCQFGEFCPTRQNSTPIAIGTNFTEPTSGLVGPQPGGNPFAYDGARTGNNRTAPPIDTTNVIGDSEISDWAITTASYSNTCPVGTICGVQGVSPVVAYATLSASVNSSIGAATMATAGSNGNTYRFSAYTDQTVLGASCAANSTAAVNIIFTDPNTSSTTTATYTTMTIVTNGTVGTTNSVFSNSVNPAMTFRAKAGTAVQYSVTFTPGAGCSPAPSYQVYPVLEIMN